MHEHMNINGSDCLNTFTLVLFVKPSDEYGNIVAVECYFDTDYG